MSTAANTPQPMPVAARLDECQALIREATTCRVKAGLYLLSLRSEFATDAAFDEALRLKGLCAAPARDSMLVTALIARMPATERPRLLGMVFDDLLDLARFIERATLGQQLGGQHD